jgi:hypothetical protein
VTTMASEVKLHKRSIVTYNPRSKLLISSMMNQFMFARDSETYVRLGPFSTATPMLIVFVIKFLCFAFSGKSFQRKGLKPLMV